VFALRDAVNFTGVNSVQIALPASLIDDFGVTF
jgi:hypothetical protein